MKFHNRTDINEHLLCVQGRGEGLVDISHTLGPFIGHRGEGRNGRGTLEQGYDPPTLFSPVNFIAGITTNTK